MAEAGVLNRLAALNAAIDDIPIVPGVEDDAFHELEEVKRGLDDARLGLWARLQGVRENDAKVFSERFRIRRCQEMTTRLTTDLRLGLMPADHPEFADLWIEVTELAKAIQEGRGSGKRET
jgi:hypothetical protein